MKSIRLPLAAAVLLCSHPQFSLAQSSADSASEHTGPQEGAIEEMLVTGKYSVEKTLSTATGLGLTLQETPQSVSILTFERMQDQNITTILEAVNNAVSVSSEEVDNVRNNFYSRGFRIDSYQIDGVPTSWSLGGDSGETVADTAIYERIEFVRGATGLLTGVGDPSASINLVRKHADSRDLTGFVDFAVGSWDKRRITADVSSGLNQSGSLRGRVVARALEGESHVDYYEDDKNIFYGVLESDLTDSTLLRVGASYQHSDPKSTVWGALPTFFSDGSKTDWDVSKTTAMDWNRWETTNTNYFASLSHVFNNGWELNANYNKLFYEKATKLLYVYGSLDKETGTGLNAQRYRSDGESEQDSIDVQLRGDYQLFNQVHDFALGALYSDQSADTFTQLPLGGDMSGGFDRVDVGNFYEWGGLYEPEWSDERTQSQASETEQRGYYGVTRLSVTDKLKFIVGGRVATWLRTGFDWSGTVDYGNKDEFIPYAGALYDVTDNHRVYASYTEIFKPQNNRDANGEFLEPLVGESSEIGLKSRFLDDRLQTTVALFDIRQDNLAQVDTNFEGTPEQQTAYIAAQGAESTGIEIEVVGQPVDGWNISAGYTQYDIEDADGNDLNTDMPTKQFKLFTSYQFSGALSGLMIGGGANWQNETYSQGENPAGEDDRFTQEAYTLVNAMARYDFTDALSLQLNAANLTDEKYYTQVGQFSSFRYGTPRNYTLGVNYRFD
ncbi:TonB-dependent siderophore receptor [Gilvimarinus xylanilyticus]|uniref:TonB-dependent siderophore receptor n=1 Tax=Gilvimarinus xylanilyticus TaxID=2944139 RepID=A0A9X2HWX5_9GAMM|nr:TonB-dependent siderophore receptor [Gilvimarinus xylanilyticus]MCP8898081.1 TonB-dependent siderophore receptor [Gilvimarinus xylanilyticus]